MAALVVTRHRMPRSRPPAHGAPGPMDVSLSLVVHRSFPLRGKSGLICLDWLGLAGQDDTRSMIDIAGRHGVTRQHVQALLRQLRADAALTPPPPALPASLALVAARRPEICTAGELALLLLEQGLSAGPLHPQTLLRAASLFDLHAGFALRTAGARTVVVSERHAVHYDRAPHALRRAARHRGLVHRNDLDYELPAEVIGLALNRPGIAELGEWAWLCPDTSQIAKLTSRLLTAVGALPIGEVIEALNRATRHHPSNTRRIPFEVMRACLDSQDQFQICDGTVVPTRRMPHLLADTDRILLDAFSRGDAEELPTSDLAAALVRAGRSPHTTDNVIGLSPLVRQTRHGVQALRRAAPATPR